MSSVYFGWSQTPEHIQTKDNDPKGDIWSDPLYIIIAILGFILLYFIFRWSIKIIKKSKKMSDDYEEEQKKD